MDRAQLRQRIAQRPHAVRFRELRRLLEAYGWELTRSTGSHRIFQRGGQHISIPFRRPHVLAAYVRLTLKYCREEET